MPTAPLATPIEKGESPEQILLGAKTIDLVLVENWGNPLAIGLTGIEVIEGTDNVLRYCFLISQTVILIFFLIFSIEKRHLSSNVKSKGLKNLINGQNVTVISKNMWCVSLQHNDIVISIKFDDFKYISGKTILIIYLFVL